MVSPRARAVLRFREGKREHGTTLWGLGDPDSTAVGFDQSAGDAQSKSRTAKCASIASARFVAAIEAVEDVWEVGGSDPVTGVANVDLDIRSAIKYVHNDRPVSRSVSDSVLDQVVEDALNPI